MSMRSNRIRRAFRLLAGASVGILTVSSLIAGVYPQSAVAGVGTSLMQTAPVVAPGKYEVKAQADIILNRGGGFNLSPHFVTGLVDHLFDVDVYFGTGTTDFQMGALTKYNLLPDLDGQLGMSFNAGFSFIRDEDINSVLLTGGILISKEKKMEFGSLSPYSSLQVEGLINSVNSQLPVTWIFGSKWVFQDSPWNFYSEVGLNLNQSFWSICLGASYPF